MKMKKWLCMLFAALVIVACNDDNSGNQESPKPSEFEKDSSEMLILCEGSYEMNNSTLAKYTFSNDVLNSNYFRSVNSRDLGDTGNSMAIYGAKIYIIVNTSSLIEVIDLHTGKSLKQIPMLKEDKSARKPRYVAFHKNKAYVCSFDNTVARIDTTLLTVEDYVEVGRNPDGICVANDKLYVSNSGGLDYPNYDQTVSVVDIESFTEETKISVGLNPYHIAADKDGNVYVASRGDYGTNKGDLQRINSKTNTVTHSFGESVANFAIHNNLMYTYSYDYGTKLSTFKVYNLTTTELVTDHFIKSEVDIDTPYTIAVNPENGNVYISNAYDFKVTGDVICFSPEGKYQYKIENVGINPNTILFK